MLNSHYSTLNIIDYALNNKCSLLLSTNITAIYCHSVVTLVFTETTDKKNTVLLGLII